MKKLIILFVAIILGVAAHAQVIGRFYYNKKWLLTKKDSLVYFRVSLFDTSRYVFAGVVQDYTRDGKIMMKGKYEGGKRNGEFTFYYTNGQIESTGLFSENLRLGIWKYFYSSGIPKCEVEFFENQPFKVLFFNDADGKRLLENGTGKWREEYEEFAFDDIFVNEGSYNNFLKEGEWTCKVKNGTLIYKESYKAGKFIIGKLNPAPGITVTIDYSVPNDNHMLVHYKLPIMENLQHVNGIGVSEYPFLKKIFKIPTDTTKIFNPIEESAYPEGGIQAFYKEIGGLIKYPSKARMKRIQGRVFVEFVVNKDGSLSDIKVVKGIGSGCDEEAVRVVQESGKKVKWMPGLQKGLPVKQRYTLPIIFKLG